MATCIDMMGDDHMGGDNSKTNLIVNYLPQSMTDKEFIDIFVPFGEIREAKIVRNKQTGYSYGYGFVDFYDPQDAEQAIANLNGTQVEHKKLKVAYARPGSNDIKQANLYVRNFPDHYTEDHLKQLFSPFGNIIQCRITGNKEVAFVLFDLHEQAKLAVDQLNEKLIPGSAKPLNVKFASDKLQKHGQVNTNNSRTQMPRTSPSSNLMFTGFGLTNPVTEEYYFHGRPVRQINRANRFNPISSHQQHLQPHLPLSYNIRHSQMAQLKPSHKTVQNDNQTPGSTLFIYNIGPDTTEQQLISLFSNFGQVVRCNVMRKNDSGESKGYGFVTMKTSQEAVNAINSLNGFNYNGRNLQVSFKTTR